MTRWVKLSDAVGTERIPKDAALVIQSAIKKAQAVGDVGQKNSWQLIEYLCAEYLAGRG